MAGYTFLSCNFAGSTFLAGVAVGNVTYEENVDRFKDHAEPLNVNGVESLIAHGEIDPSSCTVVVRIRDGVMIVTVDPRLEAKRDGKDGCTFAPDVARALEPALPKAR